MRDAERCRQGPGGGVSVAPKRGGGFRWLLVEMSATCAWDRVSKDVGGAHLLHGLPYPENLRTLWRRLKVLQQQRWLVLRGCALPGRVAGVSAPLRKEGCTAPFQSCRKTVKHACRGISDQHYRLAATTCLCAIALCAPPRHPPSATSAGSSALSAATNSARLMAANTVSVSLDAMITWLGTYKPEAPELQCHVAHTQKTGAVAQNVPGHTRRPAEPRPRSSPRPPIVATPPLKAFHVAQPCDFDGV
jgi:hypothetical protein